MILAKDYYMVEVMAAEWTYVIEETIILPLREKLQMGESPDVILNLEQQNPIYYLKKSAFNAQTLADKFGATLEQIQTAKVIRLEPFEDSGDLPAPTVYAFGRA